MTGLVIAAVIAAGAVSTTATAAAAPPAAAATGAPATGAAPGAPGVDEQYLPADKSGFGTARTTASKVWFTVQKEGGLGEIYYPTIDAPAARALQFVVSDGHGHAVRAEAAADVRTTLTDSHSLSYRQTFTARGRAWRLTATYASDPARATVLVDVAFAAKRGGPYALYAVYDPSLSNTRAGDSARTAGHALARPDTGSASAFVGAPAFTATSSGFRGTSDGWTDLLGDGRLDWRYSSATSGNLVQTAATGLTGRPGHRHSTLALAFETTGDAALATARASLRTGFGHVAAAYAAGWHRYLDGLAAPPGSLRGGQERQLYRVSAMVLAATED